MPKRKHKSVYNNVKYWAFAYDIQLLAMHKCRDIKRMFPDRLTWIYKSAGYTGGKYIVCIK